ncbi:heparin lyase I family protein, partial [Polaribacter sp. BAL334]|uniref:heparin lyase I family protein n=1 Tax=Polaribacter sp. BAL334 TaxID=1708178 RepID=UPI0018D26510
MKNKYAFFISVLTFLVCQVNAQQLLFNEGFESGILPTSSLNPTVNNPPEVVTSQDARRGTYVMKSQLNNSSLDPERSEVSLNKPEYNFEIDQEYWVGISTKLDEDFNQGTFTDDGMIMQWHYRDWLPQYTDDFKPQPFLLRYKKINGEKKIVFQHEFVDKSDGNKNKTIDLDDVPAHIGVWDDWVINIRLSETNGKFKVWRNGELVLDWSGPNHLSERPDGAYLKWGLYSYQYDDINSNGTRIPDGNSRTVYHDEVRMADSTGSFDLVSPASNTWTGNINTDWATAGNWDTGVVPIATDNVIIPEVTNAPVIGALTAAVCNNLTITETDGLTVSIGGTLTVNGTSSGAIYYMSEELVPNGDFSNTADNLGADRDTGAGDWRFQANVDAVATGDIFDEAGNNVFRAVVTTVPSVAFNLRLRQEAVVCPATATKVIFRAKASAGNMSIKVQFDGGTKPNTTFVLTTSWADYELALPASSQGTTNRLQFQLLSTGTYYIDDVAFLTTSNPTTWTGATNSNWATASNWDTGVVPIATDNVIIPEVTNAPIVGGTTTAVCNNLTITETDGLVINSGGSLIVNGTSSGNVTYNRNLGTENWYLVSSPVVGETYDNAYISANSLAINGTNNAIGSYNTADNTWSYMQTGSGATFTAGQGYSVRRATSAGAGNISFTGTINTSDVSVGVSNAGTGFNLLGNPFTSFINSATLLTDNGTNLVSTDIWVFNQ